MHRLDFSHKNLIIYLTAGIPSLSFLQEAILALQPLVDAIEIGVPYSDPVADGPVIAHASQRALEQGVNLDGILKAVQEISSHVTLPLYLMSYYAPLYAYGEQRFVSHAYEAGIRGVIVPDLNVDEGEGLYRLLSSSGLDPVLLVFPNTQAERVKRIAAVSGDFLYYVNFFGTTGERRENLSFSLDHLRQVKQWAGKPVCAGFGVGDREGYNKLSSVADGVIIGSAVMRRILDAVNEKDALDHVRSFLEGIRS
ncbi:MAG: tryptophan synthase subunit alpha [Brevinematales bacterium]|nr:tryptophan synthase subunit alpha [Brevinematales bacterium]